MRDIAGRVHGDDASFCRITVKRGNHNEKKKMYDGYRYYGGGAGIETKEAAFSDITEGGGLEAEGYFDGEEFVAGRVIIEVYK